MSRRRPWKPAAAAVGLAMAMAGCATLDSWQRQAAIFRIDPAQSRWHRVAPEGTEAFDLRHANGDVVHAWFLASDQPDAPTVLYLHGSRWNLNNSVFRFQRWHEMGFNVLAIDYRGFGLSSERLPSEASAAEDVRLAFGELKRREPDPAHRFVYGHSLGGALAIHLAASNGAAPEDGLAGIIVESSFTRVVDLVRDTRWGWVPAALPWLVTQPFDSLARLPAVDEPLLVIHGTADTVVPHAMSDRLYEAATAVRGGLKRLLKVEGGNHSASSRIGGETYAHAVREFADEATALWRAAAGGTGEPLASR